MITKFNDYTVKVEWRHGNPDFIPIPSMGGFSPFVGTKCICTITLQDKEPIEIIGEAKLHPGDSFCKDKGRRISLQRVITTKNFVLNFGKTISKRQTQS